MEFNSKGAPISEFLVSWIDMRNALCFIISEFQNHLGMKLSFRI